MEVKTPYLPTYFPCACGILCIAFSLSVWTSKKSYLRKYYHPRGGHVHLKVGLCLHSQHLHNKLHSGHNRVLRSTHNNLSQLVTTCCESWSHSYSHNMAWLLTTCCGRPEHPSQQVHNMLWRSSVVVDLLWVVDLSTLLWTCCERLLW